MQQFVPEFDRGQAEDLAVGRIVVAKIVGQFLGAAVIVGPERGHEDPAEIAQGTAEEKPVGLGPAVLVGPGPRDHAAAQRQHGGG